MITYPDGEVPEFDDEEEENEIIGYECLCCGSDFDVYECDGDTCPICTGSSLSALYF